MESINYKNVAAYSRIINQHGSGYDGDGYYVYTQNGEGIGSFLASLFRGALPIIGSAIKGATKAAIPHLQTGAKRAAAAGGNHIINNYIASKKRRKTRKIRTAKI